MVLSILIIIFHPDVGFVIDVIRLFGGRVLITWVIGWLLDRSEASRSVGVVLRCNHFVRQVHIFLRLILLLKLFLDNRLLLLLFFHICNDLGHGELLVLRLTHRPHFELWLLFLCLYGLLLLIFLWVINNFDLFRRLWLSDSLVLLALRLDYFRFNKCFFGFYLLVKWFNIHLLTFLLTLGLWHYLIAANF